VTVKKRFVGGNPPFYLQVVFLVLLLFISKKNQKYKNIFAETIRGTKISSPIQGKNVTRFGQKGDTILPHL